MVGEGFAHDDCIHTWTSIILGSMLVDFCGISGVRAFLESGRTIDGMASCSMEMTD